MTNLIFLQKYTIIFFNSKFSSRKKNVENIIVVVQYYSILSKKKMENYE